jgi:hypothetical protein
MAQENDIVLIYFEDKPLSFARIEEILPDSKPNWYHVKLMLLHMPLQVVTWILRDVYINGEEFTMNGKRMRLEEVVAPQESNPTAQEDGQKTTSPPSENGNGATVISFNDRKKK